MESLQVYEVNCYEKPVTFKFYVAERSLDLAVTLVQKRRPRVEIIESNPDPIFEVVGTPRIHKME